MSARRGPRGATQNRQTKQEAKWANQDERQPCPSPHKRVYHDRKQAKAALKAVGKEGLQGRRHAYLCACGRFHIGTVSLKPGRASELE